MEVDLMKLMDQLEMDVGLNQGWDLQSNGSSRNSSILAGHKSKRPGRRKNSWEFYQVVDLEHHLSPIRPDQDQQKASRPRMVQGMPV